MNLEKIINEQGLSIDIENLNVRLKQVENKLDKVNVIESYNELQKHLNELKVDDNEKVINKIIGVLQNKKQPEKPIAVWCQSEKEISQMLDCYNISCLKFDNWKTDNLCINKRGYNDYYFFSKDRKEVADKHKIITVSEFFESQKQPKPAKFETMSDWQKIYPKSYKLFSGADGYEGEIFFFLGDILEYFDEIEINITLEKDFCVYHTKLFEIFSSYDKNVSRKENFLNCFKLLLENYEKTLYF